MTSHKRIQTHSHIDCNYALQLNCKASPFGLSKAKPLMMLALVTAALLFWACSSSSRFVIGPANDLSAQVSITLSSEVVARIRSLQGAGGSTTPLPLFDTANIRKRLDSKAVFDSITVTARAKDSLDVTVHAKNIADLVRAQGSTINHAFLFTKKASINTIDFTLDRRSINQLITLIGGIDQKLISILSPPALSADSLTRKEYRDYLTTLLGQKAFAAFEAGRIRVEIVTPSPPVAASGGRVENGSFLVEWPLMDILVLDSPITFSVSWKPPSAS